MKRKSDRFEDYLQERLKSPRFRKHFAHPGAHFQLPMVRGEDDLCVLRAISNAPRVIFDFGRLDHQAGFGEIHGRVL